MHTFYSLRKETFAMTGRISHVPPSNEIKASESFGVKVNKQTVFTYHCRYANYAILSGEGCLHVEVTVLFPFKEVKVRPLSLGIKPETDGPTVRFTIEAPAKISMEFDEDIRNPLFLLVNPLETEKPVPGAPGLKYFEGGKVYDAGELELKEGETLYIDEGSVVYGYITATKADNVRIHGRGILDGSRCEHMNWPRKQMVLVIQSENVTIEGITVVNGPNWHIVPTACSRVTVKDLNVITFTGTGDGIDVVGSENVTITNCFVRSNDDCIAIKAVDYMHASGMKNVHNVSISRCVFWNAEWGNALEIGYETRCDEMTDIVFKDCDVIRSEFEGWQSGGTFTIHNGDRAVVRGVLYEDIRIEDSREKLIDIKILFSKYSKDALRGQVSNIGFTNIQIVDGPFPVSIIQGYDGEHLVKDVTIEKLSVQGRKISNANEAKMVVELSENVKFP
jgi:hypothetical protein